MLARISINELNYIQCSPKVAEIKIYHNEHGTVKLFGTIDNQTIDIVIQQGIHTKNYNQIKHLQAGTGFKRD
jgi:hypothetical protein